MTHRLATTPKERPMCHLCFVPMTMASHGALKDHVGRHHPNEYWLCFGWPMTRLATTMLCKENDR